MPLSPPPEHGGRDYTMAMLPRRLGEQREASMKGQGQGMEDGRVAVGLFRYGTSFGYGKWDKEDIRRC